MTDVTNGIIVTFSCCHSSLTSMANGVYFSLFLFLFNNIFVIQYCYVDEVCVMTVMSGLLQGIVLWV